MLSWGVKFPHKNGPIPSWLAPPMITSKSPPSLSALPIPITMATMIPYMLSFYPPLKLFAPPSRANSLLLPGHTNTLFLKFTFFTTLTSATQIRKSSKFKASKCRPPLKILKKRPGFARNPQPLGYIVQRMFFKFNPYLCC